MAELGSINPVRRLACPQCRALLPDWSVEEILEAPELRCPGCGQAVRLPDELLEQARRSRHLGRNLDITA